MILLRHELGDVLRESASRRAARCARSRRPPPSPSGYLSELERGEKEASSELLASICAGLRLPPVRGARASAPSASSESRPLSAPVSLPVSSRASTLVSASAA